MAVGVARKSTTIDCLALVEAIRGVLTRSRIFEDGVIRPPVADAQGGVTVDVTFPGGATALRVTAPSDQEAYVILHELASTMVEIVQDPHLATRERTPDTAAGVRETPTGRPAQI